MANDLISKNTAACKIRALEKKLEAYASGEKYTQLKKQHKQELAKKDKEIKQLKSEGKRSSQRHKKNINDWYVVVEEIERECLKKIESLVKTIKNKEQTIDQAYEEIRKLQDLIDELKSTIEEMAKQLEEADGKIQKLTAQVNKDYTNSSKTSAQKIGKANTQNSRKKTGRKQGGQPKHPGHKRKKQTPTNIITLETPAEYLDESKYKPTGKVIKKQLVGIKLTLEVNQYEADEYRNVETNQRVHATFPDGVVDDVNYASSVKAFAFLLNNYCNVSIAKVKEFMRELTDGALDISTGFINGLAKKFSNNTKAMRQELFDDLVKGKILQTDYTPVRVGGLNKQVLICANPTTISFYASHKKGHEGIKNTPVESALNILVHDHEATFFKYGKSHQCCMVHILRYLKGSMENEPNLSWHEEMHETIQSMIHFAKQEEERSPKEIEELVKKYDDALIKAFDEYEENPPNKYYRDGLNVFKRLRDFKDDYLRFLTDPEIPWDNNFSERLARVLKRKMHQMTTFRSFEQLEATCACLSIIQTQVLNKENIIKGAIAVFDIKNNL